MATPATQVNATSAALLGLLHAGPRTGGELVAEAAEQFGSVFSVTRSQVYRELPVLAETGLLRLGKQGARSSQQYRITAAGKRAFRAWLAAVDGTDPVRSPLVLRVLYADTLDTDARADLVATCRQAYAQRLVGERATAKAATDPLRRAVADFAVAHTRSVIKLLDAVPLEDAPEAGP